MPETAVAKTSAAAAVVELVLVVEVGVVLLDPLLDAAAHFALTFYSDIIEDANDDIE